MKRARFIAAARFEFFAEVIYYSEAERGSVVYRPESEGVIVFALAHHSRQPGYWRARTR